MKLKKRYNTSYIVYDENGKILKTGTCPSSMLSNQAKVGQFVIEGKAKDNLHKIDIITKEILNKTVEEIEQSKPIEPEIIPFEQQQANITNEQYQNILDKLNKL